jgi:hypothetical protein
MVEGVMHALNQIPAGLPALCAAQKKLRVRRNAQIVQIHQACKATASTYLEVGEVPPSNPNETVGMAAIGRAQLADVGRYGPL